MTVDEARRRAIVAKFEALHNSLFAEITAEILDLAEPKREKFRAACDRRFGRAPWPRRARIEFVAAATKFEAELGAWLASELEAEFVPRIRALDAGFARECGIAVMPGSGEA
jgi:hypothetical protein